MRSSATPGIGPTTSRLQFLFMNDGLFVQKGCGSPKAFFAPYLR